MAEEKLSSGVQKLINRLQEEGVSEGRSKAETIVNEAHQKAREIVNEAHEEADRVRKNAREEVEHYTKSARQAMELAARDTVLGLKSTLTKQFARRIGDMVSQTLRDEAFMQKMILEVVHRAIPEEMEGKKREIILPHDVVGLKELRLHPEKVKEGGLGQFVLSVSQDLLKEGVTIREGTDKEAGLRICLSEEDVCINLTEESITELLLEHLLPRFRALLEGSIQ